MKNSNMLDNFYDTKDINQRNGKTGWRSTERALNVRLFTPVVQQGKGDGDRCCSVWLTQVVAVISEFNTSLGGGCCSIYSQDYPSAAGVRQGDRDQGAVLLLLAHRCSGQQ